MAVNSLEFRSQVAKMVLKNRQQAISEYVAYQANSTTQQKIPRNNLIRRILLKFSIKIDTPTGATKGSGIKNDNLLNLIKRMRIQLEGVDNIFDVDLRTYAQVINMEYGSKLEYDTFAVPAVGGTQTVEIIVPIDFSLFRHIMSYYGNVLPANFLGSLNVLIDWGDISNILTTVGGTVISSDTKCNISIVEVYDTEGNTGAYKDVVKNIVKVYEGVQQVTTSKKYDSYPANALKAEVLPVAAQHMSALLFALNNITDGNPLASNTIINDVKVQNVRGGGELLFLENFKILQKSQAQDYRLESENPKGVAYLDWQDARNGGLANQIADALYWQFLTDAPTASKENAIRIYVKFIATG